MILHSGDPHSWNNSLAHATFDDNVDRVGKDTALQLLREDIRSWIRERKGQSSQWSLYVRDGQMVTQTGVSLEGMTENITNGPHSNLVPEDIKATAHLEAATLDEATRLAVAGADRIVLPEQHLDAQGNVVSRYLSVWTKNASDASRYDGSRIDLGKNIRIEDVRTGASFTAFGLNEDITFHQHGEQKQAFVLEVKNDGMKSFEVVEKAIITTIHRSHQETYVYDSHPNTYVIDGKTQKTQPEVHQTRYDVFDNAKTVDVPDTQRHHDVDLFFQAPRAVVRETIETARGVAVFLRDKEKRKEGMDRIRRFFVREKKLVDNNNAAALWLSTEQKSERLTVEKIREKPVKVVEEIGKRYTEMRQKVAALLVVAETKVALGAVPLVLAALVQEQPKTIRAVEKSIRRHERKVRRMRKNSEKVQPLKTERVEPLRDAKERKVKEKRGKEIGVKKVAIAEKLTPMVSERRERRLKRRLRRMIRKTERVLEAKRVPKKERKLWVALVVAGAEFKLEQRRVRKKTQRGKKHEIPVFVHSDASERAKMTHREDASFVKQKERVALAGVRFAWIAWMMLRTNNESKQILDPRFRGDDKKRIGNEKEESTPWVLLSIIWYLTAIREQGLQNTTNTTNPTLNGTNRQSHLLSRGVIFAYAS